jgi:DNA invertase Pin-like site-specific DNA recombinase
MRYAYARRTLNDEDFERQQWALKQEKCRLLIDDNAVGGGAWRRELSEALEILKSGDVLIVPRVSVLGRSIAELIEIAHDLTRRGIELLSLNERIDTAQVFKVFAAIERDHKNERMSRALQRSGARRGPKRKLAAGEVAQARRLIAEGENRVDVADELGVSRTTLYRALLQ